MDVLFVQPRDFRIEVLEKKVNELSKQVLQRPAMINTADGASVENNGDATEAEPSLEELSSVLHTQTGLQNDINLFYESWNDKSKTDLQRDNFEESFIGQKVVWKSKFNAVTENSDGLLWVSLGSPNDEVFGLHVIAIFESSYKEALLLVNEGDEIYVTGEIEAFDLAPKLINCSLSKKI